MKRIVAVFLLALATALPAAGQSLNLPIVGGLLGDLTVTFEGVTGLNLLNLGASIQLVSPLDPALRARLPQTVSIPPGLPVLVRITPAGGLLFTGITTVQIHSLLAPSAPRMYAASSGGSFSDITSSVLKSLEIAGGVSYRVLGTRGGFSEFLIVSDATPAATVIAGKLDHLDQILADNAGVIAGGVLSDLSARLATLRGHVEGEETAAAIQDLGLFLAAVTQHSGAEIPNVWRAAGDLVNVAGQLRAGGETLRFSLRQELGQ
jgi:hypothetical protein